MRRHTRGILYVSLFIMAFGIFFIFASPAIFGADPGGSASPGYNSLAGGFIALLGAVGVIWVLVSGRRGR